MPSMLCLADGGLVMAGGVGVMSAYLFTRLADCMLLRLLL